MNDRTGELFTVPHYKKELTEAASNEITSCQVQKTQQKEGWGLFFFFFSIWAPVRLWNWASTHCGYKRFTGIRTKTKNYFFKKREENAHSKWF